MNVPIEEARIAVENGKALLYISDGSLDSMISKRKEELDGHTYINGIDTQELWNFDTWFISTIGALLEHFLNHHVGYPAGLTSDEWNDILKEMVDCIKFMDEDRAKEHLGVSPHNYDSKVYDFIDENKRRFFELFSEWFFNLWD